MSTSSTTREPRGPPRKPPSPPGEASIAREPSSSCRSLPRNSSGGAAGGSSDSRSSACSTVTATSSVVAAAAAFQPPRGSIGWRQGGASSTYSSDAALGQEHRGVVGAGVEVHGARRRSSPSPPPPARVKRAEDLVRARLRQLGLGGRGAARRGGEGGSRPARDAAARRPPRRCRPRRGSGGRRPARTPRRAVRARTGRAGQARLSRPESVAKAWAAVSLTPGASASRSRPRSIMRAHSGVRDEGRGPHVAVEREQGDDGDAGHEGHGPERAHPTPPGGSRGALEASV